MEEKNYNNIVDIVKGREHEILVNQPIYDESGLMYPAFISARAALRGIIKSNRAWYKDYINAGKNTKKTLGLYGYANNIIAFCAQRGQGKTSAMLSFTRALGVATTPGVNESMGSKEADFFSDERLHSNRFYILPPIDPTMIDDGESVLRLVLSKLYQEINKYWENADNHYFSLNQINNSRTQIYENQWTDILERFQSCYEWLNFTRCNNDKRDRDEFEDMLLQGDVFNLKEMISEIITFFFTVKGLQRWPSDRSFIVVQLDDTDMQFENAYEILEDVRKYLSIPNVIVMMAVNLDQLRELIKHHYVEKCPEIKKTELHYMAAKYLDKLIPISQTIYLPTLKLQRNIVSELRVKIHDGQKRDGSQNQTYDDLELDLFRKIYDKTGLVFLKHSNYLHDLIPTTLRGLQQLYRLLNEMEEPHARIKLSEKPLKSDSAELVEDMCDRLKTRRKNILLFEHYFLNDWCSSKLDMDDWQILRNINDVAPERRFLFAWKRIQEKWPGNGSRSACFNGQCEIRHALTIEEDKLYNGKHKKSGKENSYSEIQCSDSTTGVLFISDKKVETNGQIAPKTYADFLRFLSKMNDFCITEQEYRFFFALRTYFTIQLFKCAIADELHCLSERLDLINKENSDADWVYFCLYESLYYAYMGSNFKVIPGEKLDNVYQNFWKCLQDVCNGSTQPTQATISDVKSADGGQIENEQKPNKEDNDIFSLFEGAMNLLQCSFFLEMRLYKQFEVLQLQEQMVYLCCDWDMQDQFIKMIQRNKNTKGTQKQPSDIFVEFFGIIKGDGDDNMRRFKSCEDEGFCTNPKLITSIVNQYKGKVEAKNAKSNIMSGDSFS